MKKIKTAFIYKPSNPYMARTAWATTYYHFFMNALNRHADLDMAYFPAEKKFDVMSTEIIKRQKVAKEILISHSRT